MSASEGEVWEFVATHPRVDVAEIYGNEIRFTLDMETTFGELDNMKRDLREFGYRVKRDREFDRPDSYGFVVVFE